MTVEQLLDEIEKTLLGPLANRRDNFFMYLPKKSKGLLSTAIRETKIGSSDQDSYSNIRKYIEDFIKIEPIVLFRVDVKNEKAGCLKTASPERLLRIMGLITLKLIPKNPSFSTTVPNTSPAKCNEQLANMSLLLRYLSYLPYVNGQDSLLWKPYIDSAPLVKRLTIIHQVDTARAEIEGLFPQFLTCVRDQAIAAGKIVSSKDTDLRIILNQLKSLNGFEFLSDIYEKRYPNVQPAPLVAPKIEEFEPKTQQQQEKYNEVLCDDSLTGNSSNGAYACATQEGNPVSSIAKANIAGYVKDLVDIRNSVYSDTPIEYTLPAINEVLTDLENNSQYWLSLYQSEDYQLWMLNYLKTLKSCCENTEIAKLCDSAEEWATYLSRYRVCEQSIMVPPVPPVKSAEVVEEEAKQVVQNEPPSIILSANNNTQGLSVKKGINKLLPASQVASIQALLAKPSAVNKSFLQKLHDSCDSRVVIKEADTLEYKLNTDEKMASLLKRYKMEKENSYSSTSSNIQPATVPYTEKYAHFFNRYQLEKNNTLDGGSNVDNVDKANDCTDKTTSPLFPKPVN